MLFAVDTVPTWQSTIAVAALFSGVVTFLGGLVGLYYMKRQADYMKRQADIMAAAASKPTEIGQPVTVKLVEEMHEQFADKEAFEALLGNNTERHAQLFKTIERVEREARLSLTAEVAKINTDRARTMEKLNEQFTFIREQLAAINTELKLNRHE